MNDSFRVVVDTNVVISGLFGIKDSPSSQVLQAFRNQKFILISSPSILAEIGDVINRERIVKLTKMSIEERVEFMNGLIERSDVVSGEGLPQTIGRDTKDDKFLACAVEAKADYIITGDEDLLVIKNYEGIEIVTPRNFLEILER